MTQSLKNTLIGLAIAIGVVLPNVRVYAQDAVATAPQAPVQDEKAQRKEWKKRMKAMDPLDLMRLTQDRDAARADLSAKETELTKAQNKLRDQDEQLAKLKAQVDATAAPATSVADAEQATYAARHQDASKGVLYKVQIGSFRNKDLDKYLNNTKNFSGDIDADGTRKYTLGQFADYWEADNFKKYLREMGVADAWVVAYREGKRTPLKDVLEGNKNVSEN